MTLDPDPLLAAALSYAERGWPTFRLGKSKRPVANCATCRTIDADHDPSACACLCCHGFHAATTNPDRITTMRVTHPRGLLAIRTGAASGLLVADIDPRNGGRVHLDLMPPTAIVRTGSGGWHLYYRHPGVYVPSRGLPGYPGVDIKADGGYVAAPPSIHPSTKLPYRWVGDRPVNEMPPPLLAACLAKSAASAPCPQRPASARTQPATSTTGGGGISNPTALLTAHLDAVHRAPQGRRRTALYGAARGVARMVAAGALTSAEAWEALTVAGRAAGQTDRDIRAAITGGFANEGLPAA